MIEPLSANAQAILLLTAPLVAGRGEPSPGLFTLGDYNRLVRLLREERKQPADLIGPDAREVIEVCGQLFPRARLETLLGRGFLLSQAMERWNTRAIWVISRADAEYPRRLKARLREDAPPVLYGCGDSALLDKGGLAVVGSRQIDDELLSYTENVGRMSAQARLMIVSGGARGIDQAAMRGALMAGGIVAGVLADSLERAALAHDHREPVIEGRLVFISPFDPAAGFNVGHAMQRNKLVYALADAALVMSADFEKGGTWAGAIEQLERLHLVPVFVRNGVKVPKGNAALLKRGARNWPNPRSGEELAAALVAAADSVAGEPRQDMLPLTVRESAPPYASGPVPTRSPGVSDRGSGPVAHGMAAQDEALSEEMRQKLQQELVEARTEVQVARLLAVSKPLAKNWLGRLVADGVLERVKKAKTVRYRTIVTSDRLL